MQLSNMFPVLIVVLMQGHALVQCFECTSQDYSKAACGLYVDVPGTKGSQADDPDQDGAGITRKLEFFHSGICAGLLILVKISPG
jgi:hypothetical protein